MCEAAQAIRRLMREVSPKSKAARMGGEAKESLGYAMKALMKQQQKVGAAAPIPYSLAEAKRLQLAIKRLVWMEKYSHEKRARDDRGSV
jgi:hypothetical protein